MRPTLQSMTMPDFAEAMARGAWLILPLGATEAHGPHLSLGADMMQAEYVALAVARSVDGIVAPGFAYGLCRTTRHFPGTVSVSAATLGAFAREVMAGYVEWGARKIAVLSGHGGSAHLEALREAALSLVEEDERLTLLVIGPADIPLPGWEAAGPPPGDGHAGCLETSVLLAIDVRQVRMDRAVTATPPAQPPWRAMAHPEQRVPSGVMGDPSKASRARGQQVLGHVIGEIVRCLRTAPDGGG